MQDFQEVIEDSQLINAMYDDTPKPVEAWFTASSDDIEIYESNVRVDNPEKLALQHICNTSLGFYLFTKFLRMNENSTFAHFLVDCAKYRSAPQSRRKRQAHDICTKYLITNTGMTGATTIGGKFPVSLARNRPLETGPTGKQSVSKSSAEWLVDASATPANALHITGPLVDQVVATVDKNLYDSFSPNLFDELDDAVFSLVVHHENVFKETPLYRKYVNIQIQLTKPVLYSNFQLFRTLGRGGFGLVNGCKKTQSGQLYAMKALCRKRIKLKKASELCLNEKSILQMVHSPFIVCMQYAFTSPKEVYLILDLMVGGDLGFYLHRTGSFSPPEAKYFVARTVLGLKALHDVQVAYRDLKPENILMDSKGRTKISDLGLACVVPKKGLSGTYGTRGYWAPEMLRRDKDGHRLRYGCEVDWWSLGCVAYEFIAGVCPFKTDAARKWNAHAGKDAAGLSSTVANRSSTTNKSTKSTKSKARSELEERIDAAVLEMEPDFSDSRFDENSASLCRALLAKDSSQRLGSGGAQEVMDHPYFHDMNWDDIISEETPPPTQPRRDLNMATQDEIGTFSDAKLAKKVELKEEDLAVFANWDYVRPDALYDEAVRFMLYEEEHGKIVVRDQGGLCCVVS
mmetsp:Transcript_2721/g.4948  ORF Transcript_2721/g.4948 Transcript_2721/m.4948 type:complete len:629 (+) Transcript_2721:97-1983(+)